MTNLLRNGSQKSLPLVTNRIAWSTPPLPSPKWRYEICGRPLAGFPKAEALIATVLKAEVLIAPVLKAEVVTVVLRIASRLIL